MAHQSKLEEDAFNLSRGYKRESDDGDEQRAWLQAWAQIAHEQRETILKLKNALDALSPGILNSTEWVGLQVMDPPDFLKIQLRDLIHKCPIGWNNDVLVTHRNTTDADIIKWVKELRTLVGLDE